MGATQFVARQKVRIVGDSDTVVCGGVDVATDQQLVHVVMTLYKHGAAVGTERFRLKIFTDEALTKIYATGSWLEIADISGVTDYWRGRVRFDFDTRPWLETGSTYWIAMESDGYTRDGIARYISFCLDTPYPVNTSSEVDRYPLEMALYSYQRIAYR